MSSCTFFGHRDAPSCIKHQLRTAVIDLIENRLVDCFYVGRQGTFDAMVRSVFDELREKYPSVCFYVVLEQIPKKSETDMDYPYTIYPEGMEYAPPRFAIFRRNEWMLKKSDYVITYVERTFGGAARFEEMARKSGKTVIKL